MKAFTLLEMMAVVAILGVAALTVAPIIGERAARGDEQVAFFTELLQEHLAEARRLSAPVQIVGFKGSPNIMKYDGLREAIPGVESVQTVKINDKLTPSQEYYITVYPDGICDYFEITAANYIIKSNPILMTVSKVAL